MRRSLAVLAAAIALVRCDCSEPPNLQGEGEGEVGGGGEGEGDVGEGEGEGEGPVACAIVHVGDNVPAAVGDRFVERIDAITEKTVVVHRGGVAPDGVDCDEAGSVAFVVGDAAVRADVVSDEDVEAAGPEGYVLKNGVVDGVAALVTDGNPPADDHRSPGGAAYGAYAMLEELGYGFLHPLAPTVPEALPETLPVVDVSTGPRWHIRNIHLHTMHPLELTELVNGWGESDPDDLDSWNAMRPEWSTYLEWIIANGQNEVEWVLLEAASWEDFSQSAERQRRLKLLVDDCHAYGVACGIDVPIALQQQHTFRLVRDANGDQADEFRQIHERLDYLMVAGFDFLSTENGSTEFTNPGAEVMLAWMDEVARYLDEEYDVTALIKIHCSVGQTAEPYTDENGDPLNFNFLPQEADPRLGVMPHTVQMYGLDDPAPTYANEDFGYIRDFLHSQVGPREVVWHPETAYWVSVDIDIPIFLPLYAERRVADLQLLADDEDSDLMGPDTTGDFQKMDGQSIFSSGWEWGYWLNDVVAARAAWDPFRGQTTPKAAMKQILKPLARVLGAAGNRVVDDVAALAEDERALLLYGDLSPNLGDLDADVVRKNGFAYLAGFEAFDDLADAASEFGVTANLTQPSKLGLVEMRNPFHAAPSYTGVVDVLLADMVALFSDGVDDWSGIVVTGPGKPLFDDMNDSLIITKLRAEQLLGLYTYVDNLADTNDDDRAPALAAARAALDEAAAVVERREAAYRVPADRIAGWRENPTSYNFTYLWTVRSLYFWWRDEGKAVDGPLSPCYLNIIDPADVALGEGSVHNVARIIRELGEGGFAEPLTECLAAPTDEPSYPQDNLRSRP